MQLRCGWQMHRQPCCCTVMHQVCMLPLPPRCSVFGVDVPSTLVFDYPTIDDLAEELAGRSSGASLGVALHAAAQPLADVSAPPAAAVVLPQQSAASSGEQACTAHSTRHATAANKPLPPGNPNTPTLTQPGYFTVPSG